MGGRGSSSWIGGNTKPRHETKHFVSGWHYPGISKRLDQLETALDNARSFNRINSVANALRAQDRVITQALESDSDGNKRVLMSLRRRTRTLMKKAKW